jgi:hypothetical protein
MENNASSMLETIPREPFTSSGLFLTANRLNLNLLLIRISMKQEHHTLVFNQMIGKN